VYVKAVGEQGYPLLQKVLAGYGQEVVMEDTLEEALEKVFIGTATNGGGGSSGDGGKKNGTPQEELAEAIAEASDAYADGQRALASGDFAAYGKAQDRLKAALDAAAKAQGGLAAPAPTISDPPTASPASPEPVEPEAPAEPAPPTEPAEAAEAAAAAYRIKE